MARQLELFGRAAKRQKIEQAQEENAMRWPVHHVRQLFLPTAYGVIYRDGYIERYMSRIEAIRRFDTNPECIKVLKGFSPLMDQVEEPALETIRERP